MMTSEFEDGFNKSRIEIAREVAFGGRCSVNVIEASHRAKLLLGLNNSVTIGSEFVMPATDQFGEESEVKAHLQVGYTDLDNPDWISISLHCKDLPDDHISLMTLRDRSQSGECSIATFELDNPHNLGWADSITVTELDESRPLMVSEDGELLYTAEAVSTLCNLLSDPNNTCLDKFIKKFNLSELAKSSFNVDVPDGVANIGQDMFRLSPEVYLYNRLQLRLGKMALKERIVLDCADLNPTSLRVTDRATISSSLTKLSEQNGMIDWKIQFGSRDNPIGQPVEYLPSVVTVPPSLDVEASFIQANGRSLLKEHQDLLEKLSKAEGFRTVHRLPKSNLAKQEATSVLKSMYESVLTFDDQLDVASQELANYIWAFTELCQTEDLSLMDEFGYAKLHKTVYSFQKKFNSQLDLLDIGELIIPNVPFATSLFPNAKNLKADIDAPGADVMYNAKDCFGVVVRKAHSAFGKASRLSSCVAYECRYSFGKSQDLEKCIADSRASSGCFVEASNLADCMSIGSSGQSFTRVRGNITNCYAENAEMAFYPDNATIDNCLAVNVKSAFYLQNYRDIIKRSVAVRCNDAFWNDVDLNLHYYRFKKESLEDCLWVSKLDKKGNEKFKLHQKRGRQTKAAL